jgi:hypothetical protein
MTHDVIDLAARTDEFARRRYNDLAPELRLLIDAFVVAECLKQRVEPPDDMMRRIRAHAHDGPKSRPVLRQCMMMIDEAFRNGGYHGR